MVKCNLIYTRKKSRILPSFNQFSQKDDKTQLYIYLLHKISPNLNMWSPHPARFNSGENTICTHWIQVLVDTKASLDNYENRTSMELTPNNPRCEMRSPVTTLPEPSRLSYPFVYSDTRSLYSDSIIWEICCQFSLFSSALLEGCGVCSEACTGSHRAVTRVEQEGFPSWAESVQRRQIKLINLLRPNK
jgi:hypothetical protein